MSLISSSHPMHDGEVLNQINFEQYAKEKYNNPSCISKDEFFDDLRRIKYIKRLFGKFEFEKELKITLIRNHLIILSNVFGKEPSAKMLFFKLDKKYHSFLKSFLVDLDLLPKFISEVNIQTIPTDPRIDRLLKTNE